MPSEEDGAPADAVHDARFQDVMDAARSFVAFLAHDG
jgi:hypothetical protein